MLKQMTVYGLLAASLLALTVAGCGKGTDVSDEAYAKVENGMSLSKVQGILGKGELQTGASGAIGDLGGSAKIYKWTDGEKTITVTFVNDKVTAKARAGL